MDGVCRHQTAVLTIKFSFSETMRKSHHVSALGGLEQPRPRSPAPEATPLRPRPRSHPRPRPLQPRPCSHAPGAGSAAASRSPVPRWSSPRTKATGSGVKMARHPAACPGRLRGAARLARPLPGPPDGDTRSPRPAAGGSASAPGAQRGAGGAPPRVASAQRASPLPLVSSHQRLSAFAVQES